MEDGQSASAGREGAVGNSTPQTLTPRAHWPGRLEVPRMPLTLIPSTVSQHSGVLTNHLGTSASSPTSESDNHALLDEKEDSYFSEIRNFIANSEMNQASTRMDKR